LGRGPWVPPGLRSFLKPVCFLIRLVMLGLFFHGCWSGLFLIFFFSLSSPGWLFGDLELYGFNHWPANLFPQFDENLLLWVSSSFDVCTHLGCPGELGLVQLVFCTFFFAFLFLGFFPLVRNLSLRGDLPSNPGNILFGVHFLTSTLWPSFPLF